MKYFKKIILSTLVVLMLVLTGCNGKKPPVKTRLKEIKEVPYYKQDGYKFWIGA